MGALEYGGNAKSNGPLKSGTSDFVLPLKLDVLVADFSCKGRALRSI